MAARYTRALRTETALVKGAAADGRGVAWRAMPAGAPGAIQGSGPGSVSLGHHSPR